MNREELIAKDLLSIKAVFLSPDEPFTWASGIKSPIYCDNRLTLSYPEVRNDIEKGLAELVQENYPDCEVLMGTSTAGIAHAALVADILNKPMGYVTTTKDQFNRDTVLDLVKVKEKVLPVGRLDKDTVGLLLLTNDGELNHRLISPKWKVDKVYYAKIDKKVTDEDITKFKAGITLDDGYLCKEAKLEILNDEFQHVHRYNPIEHIKSQ